MFGDVALTPTEVPFVGSAETTEVLPASAAQVTFTPVPFDASPANKYQGTPPAGIVGVTAVAAESGPIVPAGAPSFSRYVPNDRTPASASVAVHINAREGSPFVYVPPLQPKAAIEEESTDVPVRGANSTTTSDPAVEGALGP